MKRVKGKVSEKRFVGVLVALIVLGCASAAFAEPASDVVRERITLDFAGFASDAELTYPAGEGGPFPAVLLIAGSGTADMDHTVVSPFEYGPTGPRVLSANFRVIAEYLAERGFAVLRYNKRYVTGPGQADYTRFYQLTLHEMLADAETALEALKAHPSVDPERIAVYGWSEGSTIAATLAAERSDVAALVLQTPVVYPWRETFLYQIFEVGLPYVLRFLEDGYFTINSIARGIQGDGGLVAKSSLSYLVDPSYVTGLAVNGVLDVDNDGRLRAGTELTMSSLISVIDAAFAPGGYLAMYAPGVALPTLGDRLGGFHMPVLILQGGADANVPPHGARLLAEALERAGNDVTLLFYPDLGHSLGETGSVTSDNFQPIADQPLDDLAGWLGERL